MAAPKPKEGDQPFRDRETNLDFSQKDNIKDKIDNFDKGTVIIKVAPCVDGFVQGVSVNTVMRSVSGLLPTVTSKGIITAADQGNKLSYVTGDGNIVTKDNKNIIDHGMETNQFGIGTNRIVTSDNISVVAFNDISSLNDPVQYLKDDGVTAYPQVYLDPDWLSPNQMNGVIEPLDIRGTIAGATIDSPFVARTIRARLMDSVTPYYRNESFNRGVFDRDVAFIDSQELSFSNEDFKMFKEPIGDFGKSKISPYNETVDRKISNDLQDHFTNDDFNGTVGAGVLTRGVGTTMTYNQGKVVDRGETGIRNRNNIESIAFGGLLK